MAFGRRKPKDEPADESGVAEVPKASATPAERERPVENGVAGDPEGPFDIEDFDDAAAAKAGARRPRFGVAPDARVGAAASRTDRNRDPQRDMGGDSKRSVHDRRVRGAQDRRPVARGGQ